MDGKALVTTQHPAEGKEKPDEEAEGDDGRKGGTAGGASGGQGDDKPGPVGRMIRSLSSKRLEPPRLSRSNSQRGGSVRHLVTTVGTAQMLENPGMAVIRRYVRNEELSNEDIQTMYHTSHTTKQPLDFYQLGAQILIHRAEPLMACDIATRGLQIFPTDRRLRELSGLALAQGGSTRLALKVLEKLHAELAAEGKAAESEETSGVIARCYKDLAAVEVNPRERRAYLQKAHDIYRESYVTGNKKSYYTGVNTATVAVLLGNVAEAREIATEVRALCVAEVKALPKDRPSGAYWVLATLGELAVIQGELGEAANWFQQAIACAPQDYGKFSSTLRQLRLLFEHVNVGDDSTRRFVTGLRMEQDFDQYVNKVVTRVLHPEALAGGAAAVASAAHVGEASPAASGRAGALSGSAATALDDGGSTVGSIRSPTGAGSTGTDEGPYPIRPLVHTACCRVLEAVQHRREVDAAFERVVVYELAALDARPSIVTTASGRHLLSEETPAGGLVTAFNLDGFAAPAEEGSAASADSDGGDDDDAGMGLSTPKLGGADRVGKGRATSKGDARGVAASRAARGKGPMPSVFTTIVKQAVSTAQAMFGDGVLKPALMLTRAAFLSIFPVPSVVAFICAQAYDECVPRFSEIDAMREQFKAVLERVNAGFVFASLCTVADVIMLELVRERGAEINIVLPVPELVHARFVDDYFFRMEEAAGIPRSRRGKWCARVKSLLKAAASVSVSNDMSPEMSPTNWHYCSYILAGLALKKARTVRTNMERMYVKVTARELPQHRRPAPPTVAHVRDESAVGGAGAESGMGLLSGSNGSVGASTPVAAERRDGSLRRIESMPGVSPARLRAQQTAAGRAGAPQLAPLVDAKSSLPHTSSFAYSIGEAGPRRPLPPLGAAGGEGGSPGSSPKLSASHFGHLPPISAKGAGHMGAMEPLSLDGERDGSVDDSDDSDSGSASLGRDRRSRSGSQARSTLFDHAEDDDEYDSDDDRGHRRSRSTGSGARGQRARGAGHLPQLSIGGAGSSAGMDDAEGPFSEWSTLTPRRVTTFGSPVAARCASPARFGSDASVATAPGDTTTGPDDTDVWCITPGAVYQWEIEALPFRVFFLVSVVRPRSRIGTKRATSLGNLMNLSGADGPAGSDGSGSMDMPGGGEGTGDILTRDQRRERHARDRKRSLLLMGNSAGVTAEAIKSAAVKAEADKKERLETEGPTAVRAKEGPGPSVFNNQVIVAILFADVVGYSKLGERQVLSFIDNFMGRIAKLLEDVLAPESQPLVRNTWGDAFYFVWARVVDAGTFALAFSELVTETAWESMGLPKELNIRISLHAAPVFAVTDPVTRTPNYTGSHTSRAARIEPITPPGLVYCSEAFAAISETMSVNTFECQYVGNVPLAKSYGTQKVFHCRRRTGFHG